LFALVSAYASGLSAFALVHPGWKPHRVETAWFLFAFAFLFGLFGVVGTKSTSSDPRPSAQRVRWRVTLVLAAAVVAYSDALSVGFLSDDFVLLELRDLGGGWRQGTSQFVRVLPVALLQAFDAMSPAWGAVLAHAVNLALHLINGALLFAIARRLQLSIAAALFTVMFFVLWPASPEAVVWVSGLQDVLMTTASLTFVLASLDGRHPAVLVACLVIGLLSKETAVAMPLLGGLALWARGTKPTATVIKTVTACVAIALAFGGWRVWFSGGAFAVGPTRFLIKEILAGAYGTLAFPWMTAELRHAVIFGFLMIALVTLGAWTVLLAGASSAIPRVAALGTTWVILSVAPVYSLFFVSNTLEGSRYLYLSSAGWALLVGSVATMDSRPARVYRWLSGVVIIVWAITTYGHVLMWRRASAERDRIVASARAVNAPECAAISFVRATDSMRGAYVFRNGFEIALRRAGVTTVTGVAEPHTCIFSWTGHNFTKVR